MCQVELGREMGVNRLLSSMMLLLGFYGRAILISYRKLCIKGAFFAPLLGIH